MGSRPLRAQDPRWLGGYQLLARLGEGGMGTVYLGRDSAGRQVAVKAIRAEYADWEEFRARFRSEVNRVRQVPSFCTAAVLDADPDHETPYLVVEFVDGPSLYEVVSERGPMASGDLHSVAVGVAAALTAIHGAGVIHRDLKPNNVLLSLGLPKVIDFGIARALEPTSLHTRTDHVMGTVAYMAPERLDTTLGPTTPAADIFAWGSVVTFAGTGRTPFGGDTPMATAGRILTQPPDLAGMPAALVPLMRRALAKDPSQRPTATDLLQELLAVSVPVEPQVMPHPHGRRFDPRQLLEQLIAEGPAPAPTSDSFEWPRSGPFASGSRNAVPSDSSFGTPGAGAGGRDARAEGRDAADAYGLAGQNSGSSRIGPFGNTGNNQLSIGAAGNGGAESGVAGEGRAGHGGAGSGGAGNGRPGVDRAAYGNGGAGYGAGANGWGGYVEPRGPEPSGDHVVRGAGQGRQVPRRPPAKPRRFTARRILFALSALAVLTTGTVAATYVWPSSDAAPAAPQQATRGSAASSAQTLSLKGPSLTDPLTRAGRLHTSAADGGSCKFGGGQLQVRARTGSTYQCDGPEDTFSGDQSVAVDVTLADGNSCAMIWFRYRANGGYQLTACSNQLQLEKLGGAVLSNMGQVQFTVLKPGTRHEVSIAVAGQHAAVSVDGGLALQAAVDDPGLTSGQVLLGVTSSPSGAARASFADLQVRSS